MKSDLIHSLTANFENHAQQTESGVEYWLARDIQHLLGYAEWRNFNQSAISKAKTACEVSGFAVTDHFVDVNKTIQMPKNAEKIIDDLMLTRYACYLVAQNGDPHRRLLTLPNAQLRQNHPLPRWFDPQLQARKVGLEARDQSNLKSLNHGCTRMNADKKKASVPKSDPRRSVVPL